MKVLLILVDGMRPRDLADIPEAQELQRRGMLWAAEGKAVAGDYTKYSSTAKMF